MSEARADSMRDLTDEGRAALEELARRHGVGIDAVLVVLRALERSGGAQAQFSHPDLGGMGQWSRHGMIMIGDMFNSGLKARVDALCSDVCDLIDDRVLFAGGRPTAGGAGAWWRGDFGTPGTSGSQNDMRYAFFPQARRLAIGSGDHVDVYDTGAHIIHGVSQQQGASQDLRFTSQLGTVALHELTRVGAAAAKPAGRQSQSQGWHEPPRPEVTRRETAPPTAGKRDAHTAPMSSQGGGADDVFGKIERLHELQRKGILSEEEFVAKKTELLARI